MSLITLGMSHHRASISLLESVALDEDQRDELSDLVVASENVSEVIVVSTCNRTEVYAEALTFHGAVTDLTGALVTVTGVSRDELTDHLYVHYEDRAIHHAFSVAAGLDSMAVGESQILGQLRAALRRGQRLNHVGPSLNSLFQQALRVGKRVHSETGIDQVSVSLVEVGLQRARARLGDLADLDVLVIGAGGMSALAATTAVRAGSRSLTVVNRTPGKARDLAARLGAHPRPLGELPQALAEADVIYSSTGSVGLVVDLPAAADAQVARGGRPQVYIDLALPHDVAPEIDSLTGVSRAGLAELGEDLAGTAGAPQVQQADDLVTSEVAAYLTSRAAESVAPTVAALRSHAAEVVDRELARLDQRNPDLDETTRAEVRLAVHRVVEKLLHTPTVRVKEMAIDGRIGQYADAINELFDLSPQEIASVSRPPSAPGGGER